MVSVSDIVKLLDQVPIWKTIKALPKRVEELEARVAELEKTPKKANHLHTCAQCGAPADVKEIRPHPIFGEVGLKVRTILCENGHSIDYDWDPRKG